MRTLFRLVRCRVRFLILTSRIHIDCPYRTENAPKSNESIKNDAIWSGPGLHQLSAIRGAFVGTHIDGLQVDGHLERDMGAVWLARDDERRSIYINSGRSEDGQRTRLEGRETRNWLTVRRCQEHDEHMARPELAV